MNARNSLITLAEFGLRGSTSESDRLAVYDSVAILASLLHEPGFVAIHAGAKNAADALRHADELQLKFRDLLSGDEATAN